MLHAVFLIAISTRFAQKSSESLIKGNNQFVFYFIANASQEFHVSSNPVHWSDLHPIFLQYWLRLVDQLETSRILRDENDMSSQEKMAVRPSHSVFFGPGKLDRKFEIQFLRYFRLAFLVSFFSLEIQLSLAPVFVLLAVSSPNSDSKFA